MAAVSPKFICFFKGSPTLPRRPRVRSEGKGTEGKGQRPRQAREQSSLRAPPAWPRRGRLITATKATAPLLGGYEREPDREAYVLK